MPLFGPTNGDTRIISTTNLRASGVLTNSYVNSASINAENGANYLVLLIQATRGSLTSIEIRIQFSDDDATWFQESFSAVTGTTDTLSIGEHQITVNGNYRISIPLADRYIRVGVKGTGTVTSSDLVVDAVLSTI